MAFTLVRHLAKGNRAEKQHLMVPVRVMWKLVEWVIHVKMLRMMVLLSVQHLAIPNNAETLDLMVLPVTWKLAGLEEVVKM